MNWSILITFAIVLGCYFIGLIIFVIVKYAINKKKLKKELEENEKEQDSIN